MNESERLPHPLWECKYPVVFMPKYRRKALVEALRKARGAVVRALAPPQDCRIEEGHLRPAHVHRLVSIPPKPAGAAIVGYLKGKRAIHSARTSRGRSRNVLGESFWARGYCVSPVGRDEAKSREYIRHQEQENMRFDPLTLFK